MLPRLVLASLLTSLIVLPASPGQESSSASPLVQSTSASPAPVAAPVVKLAPQQAGKQPRALKYQLLPDALDQVPGNAAPLWVRAGFAARGVQKKLTEKQWPWLDVQQTPLDKLPRQEVRDFLAHYAGTLQLADMAAKRERCDWETPPVTVQNLNQVMMLDEIQCLREVANLLSLRCRLELAEGQIDKALGTLQIGFTLARHVGEADMLIQSLVGIAVSAVMLGRVEELIQLPGSPNLYWALTSLPSPFIDCRRSIRVELGTIHRSFPQLREATRGPLSAEQVNRLADDFSKSLGQWAGEQVPDWASRLGLASLAIKVYPDARKYLLGQGRTAAQIDAMPTLQVVVLYFVERYDELKDEWLKWLNLPSWQAWAGIHANEKRLIEEAKARDNPFIALLYPAFSKVLEAQWRQQRQIAGLRCAEALRLYAAGHNGEPPPRLEAITEVPLPIDPFTGKGFDTMYQRKDGVGLLDVPPPPGKSALLGRRYELASPRDK